VQRYRLSDGTTDVDARWALTLSLNIAEFLCAGFPGYAVTTVMLAIYLMADHERMRGVVYALVPRRFHVRLARVVLNLEIIVGGYIGGQVITSKAIGLVVFARLSLCRVPDALALAAFASLTDVIPFVGGLLATTPSVLSALSRGPTIALAVLLAMIVSQELESLLLVPRVYGRVLYRRRSQGASAKEAAQVAVGIAENIQETDKGDKKDAEAVAITAGAKE
jgi:predicted PurR-regulated permease PerM